MIVECPFCIANVDAKVCGEHDYYGAEDEDQYKTVLLNCTICTKPILISQELVQVGRDEIEWRTTGRLWPSPDRFISWDAPSNVFDSYEEAKKCYKAKAFSACAVMCGRVIEGICREFAPQGKRKIYVAKGMQLLLENKIIDTKLFEWGLAVNAHRNIGAHSSEEQISMEDAKDLLEFTFVMCDYIYVLNKRYESFIKRKENR